MVQRSFYFVSVAQFMHTRMGWNNFWSSILNPAYIYHGNIGREGFDVDHLSTSIERISTQLCVPLAHFRSVLSKSLWATWIQRQCRIFIRRLHLSRFVQLKYVFIKFKKERKGNALYGPFYQHKYNFGQIHGCQRDITPSLHFGLNKSKTLAFIKR